jgi:hypothetical protein
MLNNISSIIKEADIYYKKLESLKIGNARELSEGFALKQIGEIVRKEYAGVKEKLYKKSFCLN